MIKKIKNKNTRLLTSLALTFLLFFLVKLIGIKDNISDVIKAMFVNLLFGFYISIPILGFVMYKIYSWFTPIEERTEKEILKNKKITKIAIIAFVILVLILLFRLSSS